MTFYEFVQWCFRDGDAAIMSLVAIFVISKAIARIVSAFRSNGDTYHYHYNNEDEDES